MKVCVISANLGGYDEPAPWPDLVAPTGVEVKLHRLTDREVPPRPKAMTSRLLAGVPKWWGWQMLPGADVYLWLDASVTPSPTAIGWWLERLGTADLAIFRHPDRRTIREEYTFMTRRMSRPGETYLNARYRGEYLEEQFRFIEAQGGADLPLYASTAFLYRPTQAVRDACVDVWAMKCRWLLHDQLALPFCLHERGVTVAAIDEHYLRCPAALTFTRTGVRRSA